MPYRAVGLEAFAEFGERDGPMLFVNLYGVPSAERDVRAALSSEVDEVLLAAGATVFSRVIRGDFGAVVAPHVE